MWYAGEYGDFIKGIIRLAPNLESDSLIKSIKSD